MQVNIDDHIYLYLRMYDDSLRHLCVGVGGDASRGRLTYGSKTFVYIVSSHISTALSPPQSSRDYHRDQTYL